MSQDNNYSTNKRMNQSFISSVTKKLEKIFDLNTSPDDSLRTKSVFLTKNNSVDSKITSHDCFINLDKSNESPRKAVCNDVNNPKPEEKEENCSNNEQSNANNIDNYLHNNDSVHVNEDKNKNVQNTFVDLDTCSKCSNTLVFLEEKAKSNFFSGKEHDLQSILLCPFCLKSGDWIE